MKLEVGMKIRTKWGYICELININDFREPSMKYGVEASYLKDIMFIGDEDILKASYNIIDLIKEKDLVVLEYYVAKYRERIQRTFVVNKFGNYILFENLHCSFTLHLEDGKYIWTDAKGHKPKIKEILTKECFEEMAYKVV